MKVYQIIINGELDYWHTTYKAAIKEAHKQMRNGHSVTMLANDNVVFEDIGYYNNW